MWVASDRMEAVFPLSNRTKRAENEFSIPGKANSSRKYLSGYFVEFHKARDPACELRMQLQLQFPTCILHLFPTELPAGEPEEICPSLEIVRQGFSNEPRRYRPS